MRDYFSGVDSVYDEFNFKNRRRVSRKVFKDISDNVIGKGLYIHRSDALGKLAMYSSNSPFNSIFEIAGIW